MNDKNNNKLENQKFLLELWWPYVSSIVAFTAIAVLSYYPPPESARNFAYGTVGTLMGSGYTSMKSQSEKARWQEGKGEEE